MENQSFIWSMLGKCDKIHFSSIRQWRMADKDSSCTISEKVRRVNIIRLVFQVDLCLEIEKFNYDRRQLLKIQNRNKFLKIMVKRGRFVWAKN